MNCPKCGYSQEERLDCRKCGVVFNKYYLLHPPSKPAAAEGGDPVQPPPPQPAISEDSANEIADLRQSFRDLNRRFNEVEFERAERTHLRSELRALDQRFKEDLIQAQDRLAAIEGRIAQINVEPSSVAPEEFQKLKHELTEGQFVPLRKHLEEVEARLEALPKPTAARSDDSIAEGLRRFEERMAQSENDIAALVELSRSQGESLPDGADRLSKEIEALRGSLENVSLRYSEIGELKKNHLMLLNKVESFQLQLEQAAKMPERAASNRIPELETEVIALRAEARQTLQRLEALEAASPEAGQSARVGSTESKKMHAGQIEEIEAGFELRLKEALATVSDIQGRLTDSERRQGSIETALMELRGTLNQALQRVSDIERSISALCLEQEKVRNELRWSEEKITTILARSPEEPRTPIEEDVHVIRETMEELRGLLNSTARKP